MVAIPGKILDRQGCRDGTWSNARDAWCVVPESVALSKQSLDVTFRGTVLCFNANNTGFGFLSRFNTDRHNQAGDGMGPTTPKIQFS